ncbi:hypothetical protein [Gloeobacter violaceus]|uniref:hypothetical protein n=1 Tax=Gloeobacter violaceus TaxID=33072 RepID=UPI00030F1A13|nr:hypothetical protein [Gloeobacter violaceus]
MVKKRIDEQLWFRAGTGLTATVGLGLLLNWAGPSLVKLPVAGQVFLQLCRVVNATCEDTGGGLQASSRPDPKPTDRLGVVPPPPPPPPEEHEADLAALQSDSQGNSLATAIAVDNLDGKQPLRGETNPIDRQDFYRFTLNGPSTVQVLADGTAAAAAILDASGKEILTAERGPAGVAIDRSLKAGTYYAWVRGSRRRVGTYNLMLTASAIDSRPGDDTLSTATHVGILGEAQNFKDWVGSADEEDFFRFELASESRLNLMLEGRVAHASLLDRNGERLERSDRTDFGDTLGRTLEAGVYYLHIERDSRKEGAYTLNLSASLEEADAES